MRVVTESEGAGKLVSAVSRERHTNPRAEEDIPLAFVGGSLLMAGHLRSHYSGDYSRRFWTRVNALRGDDHAAVYALGVALQDLEGRTLNWLRNSELKAREKRKPRKARS